jgi:type III restriction enzyme
MDFIIKKYQDDAANELLQKTVRLLDQGSGKRLIFKAPTGSGKTIMVSEFLGRFSDLLGHKPCAFIWAAPRQLHEQSKEKLELYFDKTRAIECSHFEDLDDRQIGENEILFFNWESIRQENNIYIRENEQENNLSNVIERTRDAGLAVVLIIDESHFHAQADTSQHLITAIAPDLTIEVSATPVMQNPDQFVSVDIADVKAEEMIKKAIVLNEDFENVLKKDRTETTIKTALAGSTDEVVLDEAIKKRQALAEAYKREGVNINPLILIQLPDRRGQGDEDRQDMIVQFLKEKHDVSVDNGKLAYYLSENKDNSGNIRRHDHEAEVLIFKQAIALGWDCPRAHILVLFREWHSPEFSIQTVGRIMRVPEPERGYYGEDILNYAYVYTNIDNIVVKEDIGRDYVVIHSSKRTNTYKDISLPSVHQKRFREQTRLSPLFSRIFLEEAKASKLAEKIKKDNQYVQSALISSWSTENIDTLAGVEITGTERVRDVSDLDLQRYFDYFVRNNLSPYYPEDRSLNRVKESIYKFFEQELGMKLESDFSNIINITLSDDNIGHFKGVLGTAKIRYQEATEKREKELIHDVWEVPERLTFNDNYSEKEVSKSVMEPFFSDERWQTEKAFIEFLEQPSNKVLWWFKNGDRDATFFAVPYKYGDDWETFYVDFIVMLEDGSVGLFDPHGIHLADFAAKSDGLASYIKNAKKEGKKVFGGIVANTDSSGFTGQWMVYQGDGDAAHEGNWDNWEPVAL